MIRISMISDSKGLIRSFSQAAAQIPDAEFIPVSSGEAGVYGDILLYEARSPEDWPEIETLYHSLEIPVLTVCSGEVYAQAVRAGFSPLPFLEYPLTVPLDAVIRDLTHSWPDNTFENSRDANRRWLWSQMAWGILSPGRENLRRRCLAMNFPEEDLKLLPVLINIKSTGDRLLAPQNLTHLSTYLAKQLQFMSAGACDQIIRMSPTGFLCLFRWKPEVGYSVLLSQLEELIRFGKRTMDSTVCCYIGPLTHIGEICQVKDCLDALDRENISQQSITLMTEHSQRSGQRTDVVFAASDWAKRVHSNEIPRIVEDVTRELNYLSGNNSLSVHLLDSFLREFSQFLSITLHDFGLHTAEVFEEETYNRLYNLGQTSLEKALGWVSYTIDAMNSALRAQISGMSPIERVVNYIDNHLTEDLDIETLAGIAFFSKSHLGRAFRKEMHQSPAEYIREMRIRYAQNLLRDTALPVNKIAERVGYHSYGYFHQQFVRVTGMSPRDFRKQERPQA